MGQLDRSKMPPICMSCGGQLWDCSSCGEYQCMCPCPWADRVKPKERRLLPRQHYDLNFVQRTGIPPTLVDQEARDEQLYSR